MTDEIQRRVSVKDVKEAAKASDLVVCTWSPGDGVTRYRFFESSDFVDGVEPCYHNGFGITTELGPRTAMAWLAGYRIGRSR